MIVDLDDHNILKSLSKTNRKYPLAITSGCFDLLHSGHIFFLSQAKILVNESNNKNKTRVKLLVITHNDKDITEHKGPGRPVHNLNDRLEILNALRMVDMVGVWNNWETIPEIVVSLEPEYLVTNLDSLSQNNWKKNWRSVSKKIGAKLIGVGREEGTSSTTDTIRKIKM